jgi:xanthine dehydrogenase YagS FAD-binding subunit
MRAFKSANPRSMQDATKLSQQSRREGQKVAFAGGGSDVLGMMKEHIVTPDVLVHLKSIPGMDKVESAGGGVVIGGQITLAS